MFKINIISLITLLGILLLTSVALAEDSPVSAKTENTSEIKANKTTTPSGFSLSQNYQHPFTIIKFQIEKQQNVKLMVVNEFGQEVITIINKSFNPGNHEIKLDASDLGPGMYFCQISTPSYSETKKLMTVK